MVLFAFKKKKKINLANIIIHILNNYLKYGWLKIVKIQIE